MKPVYYVFYFIYLLFWSLVLVFFALWISLRGELTVILKQKSGGCIVGYEAAALGYSLLTSEDSVMPVMPESNGERNQMENAAALPQGLVTIYSLDGKAEGTKRQLYNAFGVLQ